MIHLLAYALNPFLYQIIKETALYIDILWTYCFLQNDIFLRNGKYRSDEYDFTLRMGFTARLKYANCKN